METIFQNKTASIYLQKNNVTCTRGANRKCHFVDFTGEEDFIVNQSSLSNTGLPRSTVQTYIWKYVYYLCTDFLFSEGLISFEYTREHTR
jgi:hypothetical protein